MLRYKIFIYQFIDNKIEKVFQNQYQSLENPLKNAAVTFNINGVFYTRYSDSNGIVRLNINLMAGEYIITSEYDNLKIANTITIKN